VHQHTSARDVRSRGFHYASETTFLTLQTLYKSKEGNLLYNPNEDMITQIMQYRASIQ
jgi:hypothetical protein